MAIVSHKEFKAFFETFFIPVYTLMQRYTGERELSRDFTQEAFVRVFEHWGEFETEENAKAFLYTVARRIYLDHCKHQKIENQYQNRVNEEELEEYDFLKEVTQQEVSRILYDAVDKLPSQTRSIILLNLKGFNNTEVAERLIIYFYAHPLFFLNRLLNKR